MADVPEAWQNGYAERFFRIIKEQEVDLSEYRNYNDAYQQIGCFLDDVYMYQRIHSLQAISPQPNSRRSGERSTPWPSSLNQESPEKCPSSGGQFIVLKRTYHRLVYSSRLIAVCSLIWLLFRTGIKPTRAIYPCQKMARTNVFVFGLPAIAPFWLRLKEYKQFRLKVLGLTLLTLFFAIGAFGLARTKTSLASWFWQWKDLPSRETHVLASTTGSRVTWVHDSEATNWDYGSHYYGLYVDQAVVNQMTDQGLRALTGTSTVAEAWRRLIPGYEPGQRIAIKINLNANWESPVDCYNKCETNCDPHDLLINALPQPVNALVRGLKQIGVAENDIWVYEASKPITNRFKQRVTDLYPGVRFFDHATRGCQEKVTWSGGIVDFQPPEGVADPPNKKLTNILAQADYLINMPIMKKHGGAGLTLSFKNHFGSIDYVYPLHEWVYGPGAPNSGSHYSSVYSPLVDIYTHPTIMDKTILTVGDGLFGDRIENNSKPSRWQVFGNDSPNSLFFSTDPVAIDSVMADILHSEGYEGGVLSWADDYLALAASVGLGVYERADPWLDNYQQIDLVRCDAQGAMDPLCTGANAPTPTLSPAPLPIWLPVINKSYRP